MLRNADRFRRGSRFKRGRRFRRIDRKPDQERKEEQSENFQDGWKSRAVLFLVSQCITLFGSTLALTVVQTAVTTLLQEQADRAVQGRIFGMQSSMYAGFLPLGMAVFGPLADVVPLQWIMIGAGGALAVLAALTGGSGGAEEEK